jgi:hypothetical protein
LCTVDKTPQFMEEFMAPGSLTWQMMSGLFDNADNAV